MSQILNEYDKALHDAIHQAMLASNPQELLKNNRLRIFRTVTPKVGSIYGTVADVGCGSGYLSVWMALNFKDIESIHAIEASSVAINQVVPRNAAHYGVANKIQCIEGSFDDLEADTYDFVFAMGALHHSRNLKLTLKSIAKSLKAGGTLISQEPAMPDSTTHEAYNIKYNIVEERFGLKIRNGDRFDRFFRECEYKAALVQSGFDIVLWEDLNVSWMSKLRDRTPRQIWETVYRKLLMGLNRALIDKKGAQSHHEVAQAESGKVALRRATTNVKRKLLIATKSNAEEIYHDD